MYSSDAKGKLNLESVISPNNMSEDNGEKFIVNKALQMMLKMGFKSGSGLGRNEQGIIEPVSLPLQFGKQGLGLEIKKKLNDVWDSANEDVQVEEKVDWLINDCPDTKHELNISVLRTWLIKGSLKLNVEDETNFCDPEILKDVLKAKGVFDELSIVDLSIARSKANPFETLKSAFFMNRAALKMANIDAATNFMFTEIDKNPNHPRTNSPYYFADVCAGPGGFTEYILWRKNWLFKGFGFTLRGDNDFKVMDSSCASSVTFHPLYGVNDDGNICCPDNIQDFKTKVLHETNGLGVHFMMSDGGFSVEGNENMQEILSKQLYVCQCLTALEIVRPEGHFVTKLFDLFTPFSVGLIYLMHKCFEKVTILKPNTSRPANSERYLICYGLKHTSNMFIIREYLKYIVNEFWEMRKNENNVEMDIIHIVPMEIIKSDYKFFEYMVDSNNRLGRKQLIGLLKLEVFCRNPLLVEPRQEELRTKCLEYWNLPNIPRIQPSSFTVDNLITNYVQRPEFLLVQPREVNSILDFEKIIVDIRDWHYLPMCCTKKANVGNFYAGVGNSRVYRLQKNKWIRQKNLLLSKGTLLYGELVREEIVSKYSDLDNGVHCKYSLHVIDALRLGDVSLADLPFTERLNLIETYCQALNHEFNTNYIRIRPKIVKTLRSVIYDTIINYSQNSKCYTSVLIPLGFDSFAEYYQVNSILLLKTDKAQSFNSTYVLRAQAFINHEEQGQLPSPFSMNSIKQFVYKYVTCN